MNEHGQALVETALVLTTLVLLALGATEFGRMWHILGIVTTATRNAARAVAITPTAHRINGRTVDAVTVHAIQQNMLTEIGTVCDTAQFSLPVIWQGAEGGERMARVTVTGHVPMVFGLFGARLPVSRSVTWMDSGWAE